MDLPVAAVKQPGVEGVMQELGVVTIPENNSSLAS